eukprot:TRINITY_DN13986_c0_g1_i2.p1 TRINITY_DN13986_c0_g1~~TRINITY_DN13986_c0_g1_i2.p1  ORF type:complete len:212 (+),score=28.32 TRINITY_DN13986_c0_g1_i2:71-706(+)
MVSCSCIVGSAVVLTYGSLSWMQYRALRDNLSKDVDADASIYQWQAGSDVSQGCQALYYTLRVSCLCVSYVLLGFLLALVGGILFSSCNVLLYNARELSVPLVRSLSMAVATLQVVWGAAVLLPNFGGLLEIGFQRDWHLHRIKWTCTECLPCSDIYTAALWTFWPLAIFGLVSVVGGVHALHVSAKKYKLDKELGQSESSLLMPRYSVTT